MLHILFSDMQQAQVCFAAKTQMTCANDSEGLLQIVFRVATNAGLHATHVATISLRDFDVTSEGLLHTQIILLNGCV